MAESVWTESSSDVPASGPIWLNVSAGVAIVTLDRPEARNALNTELRSALYNTMSRLDADPEVSVVVLTGADPAFCAGLDLKELAGDSASLGAGLGDESDLRRPIPKMSKPVIGAINGVAITGGFELALACDFLVASEHARFADTHTRVGILPGWGLTVLLPQAIGIRRAKELSCTGNFLDARTALDWGLVNHVVPHDELMPTVLALAADVVGNDPDARPPDLLHLRRGLARPPAPRPTGSNSGTAATGWPPAAPTTSTPGAGP